jgi:hypothetical protein
MTKELEDALIKAAGLAKEEGGMPDNIYHLDYGWIVLEGRLTNQGKKFIQDRNK